MALIKIIHNLNASTTGNRWALLEHTDAPNDPKGSHYDLLLEDGPCCRTWRLPQIPKLDSQPIEAILLPSHRLQWLETKEAPVSGGKGFAKRVMQGIFIGNLPGNCDEPIHVYLQSPAIEGNLHIHSQLCEISSINNRSNKRTTP